mmetsp:Transcript_13266/g.15325  ORF Transcript_13266/g.15325 Transcript_13266/m.15325 type:complete len:283 (-) Transcript_13266:887-1735(-)|eukprot:CAMPEP_0204830486 /NCGR_PEP_ID=MMETSP1346-20131115/8686_1 /ASSEMBLY_ACC=CAM_ASM_000771 /TAXON_ID=215587 /ORGANISM="Aplanochytrium stocchinoi, Strain GSBS06" /LENGTH=282 /DNA_ID=CAMNT_0051960771 /DNA_START=23 /DNA_END=871 /DNA_ORIENTATION=+
MDAEDAPKAETQTNVKEIAVEYSAEDRLKQQQEIDCIINMRPLVGEIEVGFGSLVEELKSNEAFSRKVPNLCEKYSSLRRIRGDGSCFFRGFIYILMENLVRDKSEGKEIEFNRVKELFDKSLGYLVEVGYTAITIEIFCEFAVEFMKESKFPKNQEALDKFFADPVESMYLVWFCRLLCAGYIKHNWAERFQFFVTGNYATAEDYCAKEVEPTNMECGQLQIIALCEYFQVRICVEYLGASEQSEETNSILLGPEEKPVSIYLLYRPGHYDVIYPKDKVSN